MGEEPTNQSQSEAKLKALFLIMKTETIINSSFAFFALRSRFSLTQGAMMHLIQKLLTAQIKEKHPKGRSDKSIGNKK